MNEIEQILNKNEKIIWEGKPEIIPYAVAYLLPIPVAFILAIIILIFVKSSKHLYLDTISVVFLVVPTLAMFFGGILSFFYRFLNYKFVRYYFTDKRVIFQSGIIGRDFEMTDYDMVRSLSVNVNLLDKLFGKNSGTIVVGNGENYDLTYNSLENISNPYQTLEKLKQISHDIKTDISFPNDYRPKKNKGYQTKYPS
ncbi:PH domain-containing protein [Candidatus Beckwithbacteria bacterium]|nr:PH domain-containing protein [Candidatus Beckwithbacteria bacterium]